MGQSSSTPLSKLHESNSSRRIIMNLKSTAAIYPEEETTTIIGGGENRDYISDLPDECLASIFYLLGSGERKRCSLVSRRWLLVESQSRHRLSLDARSDLTSSIPSLFTRFDSITKLALKCDRRSVSIGDDALILISLQCRNLIRLKLLACREITDAGMAVFAANCKGLKKLSVGSCTFGTIGMNAVLDQCSALEELSFKRLRGIGDGAPAHPIGPGVAAASLKSICLEDIYNGQCFGPLIVGAKNLRTLKLFRCSGDWDAILESISNGVTGLVEVHLERLQVTDRGVAAISNCLNLEILRLVKIPECTNESLVSVADRCKLLRKLHIDGWKTNRIGDIGLIAIAKHCPNLQELVLIGVNPTNLSLELLGNCQKLERLALCGSVTIGDSEITCIATKCMALRKLCIKSCPISNRSMEVLVRGCPKLIKLKIKKCRRVTSDCVVCMRALRQSLAVNLDSDSTENLDATTCDGGLPDVLPEFPLSINQNNGATGVPSNSNGRPSLSKPRIGLLVGRNLATCAFRRWSNSNNSDGT